MQTLTETRIKYLARRKNKFRRRCLWNLAQYQCQMDAVLNVNQIAIMLDCGLSTVYRLLSETSKSVTKQKLVELLRSEQYENL
jgi:hypothetical protein